MKEHIKTLHHHPKRVIIISLIVALAIGTFGYIQIQKRPKSPVIDENIGINSNNTQNTNQLTLGFLSSGRISSVSVKAGDSVKKGQVLATLDAGNALGALTVAKAAYATAQANYKKIINGATDTAIDVAKAAVNTAQVNLDGITKQQSVLVENARLNLLNSTLVAKPTTNSSIVPPIITGTYTKKTQGKMIIDFGLGGGADKDLIISGIANGSGVVNTNIPEPILDTGLYIQLPKYSSVDSYVSTEWEIDIPNDTAPNYLANYNAYQTALENQNQAVKSAQAVLDQANASLTALVSAARPEDVASAQAQMDSAYGAVQIATATYNNTIITAPSDGTITSVNITPGQIAIQNAGAIEFLSK